MERRTGPWLLVAWAALCVACGSGETADAPARATIDSGSVVAAGVRWIGRVDVANANRPRFGWSGTGFVAAFTGTSASVRLNSTGRCVFRAVVDGTPQPPFAARAGDLTYDVAKGLAAGPHTVALYRQTEGRYGPTEFLGLTVTGGTLLEPPAGPGRLIEIFGASVACGWGVAGKSPCTATVDNESIWDAFASVAGRALGADVSVVGVSAHGLYRNADGTTDGTLPKVYDRILFGSALPKWDFRTIPQAVLVDLGGNDFYAGDPGAPFRDGYLAFLRQLRATYPQALLVGVAGPNLEEWHARQLAYVTDVVDTLHSEGDEQVEVLDWPEQTPADFACDNHPNAAKHAQMGGMVAELLRAKLAW